MELRQLEYFREIASTGSINEAARHLNMSQPPLSYQIRQLENELNVKLFDRTSKGVTLTEAGKLLYDRSGNLLEYARSTELEVSKTGKKRILRIGLTPTTVDTIMPYISQFSQKNPDVNFEVHDGITYSLYQYLLDGIIDISVARTPLRLDEVSYMELCSEPMIAVSAPENVVSKTAAVTADTFSPTVRSEDASHNSSKHTAGGSLKLADLLHRPLILYRRYEELIMNTFHSQNMNPDIFCVCDDPRGAMLWAKENLATAIFPQSMASLCDGLCIQELDEPDLVTKILLIWAKGKKPVPLVQEFLDVCGER